jgi:pilus assembly protein CpaE
MRMAHRILIVDGDPATIQWLTAKFEQAGFTVASANRGDFAWQNILTTTPDLVVLDLTLPDQDGLELIRRIRQSPPHRHIGIIVLSKRVESADVSASLQAGADHYIVKRAGADIELIAKVRAQLEQPRKSVTVAPSRGRIFSFCSAKGGTGTSSVCVNTAFALAKVAPASSEILVVDLVLPMGTVAQSLGFETHKTISQLTHEVHSGIDEVTVKKYASHTLRWGFRLLLASTNPHESSKLDVNQIVPLFQTLKTMYDYILVDFGRMLSRISLPIIEMSTGIVIIVTPDVPTVRATRLMVDYLDALGIERDRLMLINNRTVGRVWTTAEDIEREVKLPLAVTIPYEVEYMSMAINAAVPFMEKFPNNAATMSFNDIARKVIERAKPKT